MVKVNTVLGEISADRLGETLCHEHVVCVNPSFCNTFGNKWFPKEQVLERAIKLFQQVRVECGVQTIIDATPIDLGRDIELMKEVSKKSGVNIIVSSGVYCNEEDFLQGKKMEKLARFFIDECKIGINRSDVKPSILKCATGKKGVTPTNETLLSAMAIAQKETGLPLYCHNEHLLKTPYQQMKIFEKFKIDLQKVVIGHCNHSCDIEYLIDMLQNGVYLGFDRVFPTNYLMQAQTIADLIEMGYEDKILLSHDFFAYYDFGDTDLVKQKGCDRDFTTVHKKLIPTLESLGIKKKQIKKLTIDNPKKVLTGR